jgi:multidrug efflux pump subunit AcrA (membrane-fusion protein)
MNRILYPILALLILGATVVQVRATRPKPAPPRVDKVAATPRVVAEGRVVTYPGAEITIGSDVAGTIARLTVKEKEHVRRGETIATIQADDTRAALGVARASRRSRRGHSPLSIRSRACTEPLPGRHRLEQAWEKADRDLDAARVRRASAAAVAPRSSSRRRSSPRRSTAS